MAWPLSVRLAHWVSAALVVGMLGMGAAMVLLVHDAAARFELIQTHKSIGVAILGLTVARLCLRALTSAPKPELVARSILLAANAAHIALYVLLLLMPLSGWLMATSTPVRVPTVVFGLFELPYPLMPDLERFHLAHGAHVVLAIVLGALIALHAAAAVVHALVWRDQTLARMWRQRVAGPSVGD
jgi:cytochrome b561